MIIPNAIFETENVIKFLKKRNLLKQYIKAKKLILNWKWKNTNLKIRQPKKDEIRYFRINNQYRALGFRDENKNLIIFKIHDHQK